MIEQYPDNPYLKFIYCGILIQNELFGELPENYKFLNYMKTPLFLMCYNIFYGHFLEFIEKNFKTTFELYNEAIDIGINCLKYIMNSWRWGSWE